MPTSTSACPSVEVSRLRDRGRHGHGGHRKRIAPVVGWVLLLPPSAEKGPQAPIAQWQHAGSFNSAKECEGVRAELIDASRRPFGAPWMIPNPDDTLSRPPKVSWADSRCWIREGPGIDSRK